MATKNQRAQRRKIRYLLGNLQSICFKITYQLFALR